MRSLFTAVFAGLLGFALARMGGPSFLPKHDAPAAQAAGAPPPARATVAVETPAPPSPSPDPAKPIAERLNAARRTKDPHEAAARSLAVIDPMTIEDFRKLGADPRRVPIPSMGSFDPEFCHGFMDALVARWFEVDPAGAFASIQELEKKLIIKPGSVWAGSGDFSAALARVHPEVLLASLGDPPTWDRFDQSVGTALTALAARDPAAARKFVERADPAVRGFAESALLDGLAKNDPVAAAESLRGHRSSGVFHRVVAEAERRGPGVLRQVLAAADGKAELGSSLTEFVLRHPNEDWSAFAGEGSDPLSGLVERAQRDAQQALQARLGVSSSHDGFSERDRRAARSVPPDERQRILARLDEFPAAARESMAGALVDAWALEEPRQATEWAFAHAGDAAKDAPEASPLAWAFDRWMSADENGVLAWWSHLPASAQRDRLGVSIASSLAGKGKLDRALEFFHPRQGAESAGVAVAIASARAKDDPAAAAAWLDSLPAELDASKAIAPVIVKWIEHDAAAAARWVETQPAGARRDAALNGYTLAATELDPAAAGEWAATITDPATRAKAAEFVFREMNRRDPPAARKFLRALPGADPAWSERLIRLVR